MVARPRDADSPAVVIHPSGNSWAYLRAAHFDGRPGHADQLHLDLWWQGLNIAQDAGTYLYNADTPWENALTHTAVHNTLMVNGREQMTRAGRFLYLDRAQAGTERLEKQPRVPGSPLPPGRMVTTAWGSATSVPSRALVEGGWQVEDTLQSLREYRATGQPEIRLHWLLPDWDYEILDECSLKVRSPLGWITLAVQADGARRVKLPQPALTIVRAGKVFMGPGRTNPTWGWVSPTYGVKDPALSLRFWLTPATPHPGDHLEIPAWLSVPRAKIIAQLAGQIAAVRCDHPLRVAIDGVDAAGKTTLAEELVAPLESSRPARDPGVYGWFPPPPGGPNPTRPALPARLLPGFLRPGSLQAGFITSLGYWWQSAVPDGDLRLSPGYPAGCAGCDRA